MLFGNLRRDIKRTYDFQHGSRLYKSLQCARSPGVLTVIVFRYGQWARSQPKLLRILLDPIYFVLNELVKLAWGIELPRATKIGPGFYIGHFGGITVSPEAIIGKNFTLSQSVTIGIIGAGDKGGSPVIGNDVFLAPGARIFGKITIGNNVKIGPNAVVFKDIPDNAIAALAPGFKIVSFDGNPSVD
jgi:serine O-acetyltransferase